MKVPLTIGDFLRRGAAVYGQRPAVFDEPDVTGSLGTVSYGELESRARGMAIALDNLGVASGERVAIVSPNAARFQIAFFGVSGYGRVLVPVNYRLNSREIRYIVEHSGATVLLVDPESDEMLADVTARHRILLDGTADAEMFAPAAAGAEPAAWDPDEDATASINYTSGTTARPKGVQLTHRNCWLNAAIFGWHTCVTDRDVFLHTLPMFHCNGWGMPYAVTGMGVPQVVVRKIDGEEILRRIDARGVTLMCGAPAVVAAILNAASDRLARGEAVPGAGTVRIVVAGRPPEWDEQEPAARARLQSRAGVPAVGVQIRTDDEGEVLARSNHVFAGYWQQSAESEKVLAGGWFATGDKGHVEAGDYLVISDRKKDVIISGGENVSSVEVEDCLYQHPAVAEVAVIGVPHDRWGETVKALVVLRDGQQASEQDLIGHCREHLAHFKCPTSVEMYDVLPRTATGKLQKFKLRAPYWEGHERAVN